MNPSRTVLPALSVTLLISWGSLYYAFAIWVQPLRAEMAWSPAAAMGAYSTALVIWGVCSWPAGWLVDRYGGRRVMTCGSIASGVLLLALSGTQALWLFYLLWAALGVCMALTLYEPAFAIVVAAWPGAYRRRIGVLTLAGGLASTVFWPLTHVLVVELGWRGTLLVYAALHACVCAPLHACCVPAARPVLHSRPQRRPLGTAADAAVESARPALRTLAFWQLAVAFAALGFVTSAMAAHVVPMLQDGGLAPAAALAVAALIGPMQVAGRAADPLLAGRFRPLAIGTITVLLMPAAFLVLLPALSWAASGAFVLLFVFAALYGAALGLLTIVRATTPVEVFGPTGYATVNGALGTPALLARGAGPLVGAWIATHGGYIAVLVALLACALGGAAAYLTATHTARSRP